MHASTGEKLDSRASEPVKQFSYEARSNVILKGGILF